MTHDDFKKLFAETVTSCEALLKVKGGEYAGDEDRLANFKRGAAHVGVKPLTVLFIYLSKHYDALATYVRLSEQGAAMELSEPIEGRLQDLINYCILARAVIEESK